MKRGRERDVGRRLRLRKEGRNVSWSFLSPDKTHKSTSKEERDDDGLSPLNFLHVLSLQCLYFSASKKTERDRQGKHSIQQEQYIHWFTGSLVSRLSLSPFHALPASLFISLLLLYISLSVSSVFFFFSFSSLSSLDSLLLFYPRFDSLLFNLMQAILQSAFLSDSLSSLFSLDFLFHFSLTQAVLSLSLSRLCWSSPFSLPHFVKSIV